MKIALIIATEVLHVLRAAHSFNSKVFFQGVLQELESQLCLVWAELVKAGEDHAPSEQSLRAERLCSAFLPSVFSTK